MIYKRGAVYWIKYYRNGKPYRESTKSSKETEAKHLLKRREGEIAQGKIPGVVFDKVRFKDLVEGFLADYRINEKKSLVRAERSVKHLNKAFDGMRVTNINSPAINRYIEKRLEEGAANATINRELAALKRIFNLAARQTPPKIDKVPYISMLKESNVRKGFFEHSDFLALREALPDYLKGFVTFAYKTGWRVSEIKGLTWSQVDLVNGIVRLETGETKNDEGRTVYLDEELQEVFQKQAEYQKGRKTILPWVFTTNTSDSVLKDFRGAWTTACETAEIGKRIFHDFRRTAIRNMVRAGIPERVAMMISGHKTRSVFDRYNIVSDTDLRLASQKTETYLQAQTGTISGTVTKIENKRGQAVNA
ncbi:MAG TPA: site-specific integrase [Anaerolineae bacterium]|nr:site-specific integrase [Anaerolineae bacterium]